MSQNNRLANTKERDASIGLDNHGFRYYDPSTGRYLTRDPIGYADGLNPYLHVHNNPINHIDPEGLFAQRSAQPAVRYLERQGHPVLAAVVERVAGAIDTTNPVGQAVGAYDSTMATIADYGAERARGKGIIRSASTAMLRNTPPTSVGWHALGAATGEQTGGAGEGRQLSARERAGAMIDLAATEVGAHAGIVPGLAGKPTAGASTAAPETMAPPRLSRKTEYPHSIRKSVREQVIRENTDADGNIIDPSTGVVIPPDQVTIDHKRPVVRHWNEEGYNQTRNQRREWYNDLRNLTAKSRSDNSSEGARLRETYRQDTGPDYSNETSR